MVYFIQLNNERKLSFNMFKIIWASIKYQYRELAARGYLLLSRLYFWQWGTYTFSLSENSSTTIRFLGRKKQLPVLISLLTNADAKHQTEDFMDSVAVYEVPVPKALCIPYCLSTVVKLDKPIEEIMASYSRSLRRSIQKQSANFHYKEVTDPAEVDVVNQTMLRPYAFARNGDGAHHLDIDLVKSIALNHYGRLDLLYEKEQQVGCHLGNSYLRRGKRYWHVNRFGYAEEVFTERKHLQDVNSINLHLALLSAVEDGYDYCDYGASLARPGSGLIEWKRRRKGFLTKADANCFYLKPPKIGVAQFFWDSPLFALESKKVTLHLGIPANKTDEEVFEKYKEMGYDGLRKVYLKCVSTPNESVLKAFECLYQELRFQPQIIVSIVK